MTFTHALSTNNYGPTKFIVATSAANGTHTTLASAMAVASAGDTIFLRDSVTENVTITPGVHIAAFSAAQTSQTVSITGKLSMSGAGSSLIYGIRLITNSDFCLSVTGSSASSIVLRNCAIIASNNTAINFSSSNSSSSIIADTCFGDVQTTGIAIATSSAAGALTFSYCRFQNSGSSTTAVTTSAAGIVFNYCLLPYPCSTSSTGTLSFIYTDVETNVTNTACVTTAGTGTSVSIFSNFNSGTASAISVGAGSTFSIRGGVVTSSNTNAITGAGTVNFGDVVFASTSSTINTTTQTPLITYPPGQVVQSVKSSTTTYTNVTATIPYDDTIPQNTEGTEIMTVSITPKRTTNILYIKATVMGSHSNAATTQFVTALFQDTTANALACAVSSSDQTYWDNSCLMYTMAAGTTSSTTFKIRVGCNLNGFEVNGQGGARKYGGASYCNIEVLEVYA